VINKAIIWGLLAFLALSCSFIDVVPAEESPKTEIPAEGNEVAAAPAPAQEGSAPEAAPPLEPTATPQPSPTPAPTATATVTPFFLKSLSWTSPKCEGLSEYECNQEPPRHGLIIAVLLPLLVLGIPWLFAEFFVIRYVQPRSIDLSEILIKAQDGMFIQVTTSLTARRSLTLASTRMTWPRVKEFVEKALEQELIHEALNFPTLDDLERNLKDIAEKFKDLPIVQELLNDFGVEVMRFNIETRYPQETMDALNRRAEASAGGTAYLAYAAAAHLDPDSLESRELYRVYQETRGQIDAARNLGGGITNLASLLSDRGKRENPANDDSDR
jgi:hypothetical protein